MVDTTLDARRLTREHEQNLVKATTVSLDVIKPWLKFNMAVCRAYAEGWHSYVDNMEKTTEMMINMAEATQQEISKAQHTG